MFGEKGWWRFVTVALLGGLALLVAGSMYLGGDEIEVFLRDDLWGPIRRALGR